MIPYLSICYKVFLMMKVLILDKSSSQESIELECSNLELIRNFILSKIFKKFV